MSDFLFFNKRLTLAEGVKTMTKFGFHVAVVGATGAVGTTNDSKL